jgi:hypothetical protein
MKSILIFLLSFIVIIPLNAQEAVSNYLFLFGQVGVPSQTTITHTLTTPASYWEWGSSYYPLSNDSKLSEASVLITGSTTSEPSESDPGAWKGFLFPWTPIPYHNSDSIAYGFYKVTNSYNNDYFYIDLRDCKYAGGSHGPCGHYNPDFYIRFNNNLNIFQWRRQPTYPNPIQWNSISTGEILNVWDIKNGGTPPLTSTFEDFWDHALVMTNNGNNIPRVVWGPYEDDNYTTSGYYVYRATNYSYTPPPLNQFSLVATLNSTTYNWTDTDFVNGGALKAHYYVKADITPVEGGASTTSSPTNIVTAVVGYYGGGIGLKDNVKKKSAFVNSYFLDHNHPNPFNPNTMISYSIRDAGLVALKVFDILGNEVAILVNSAKEPGNYEINFDASDLPSGVYIYTLQVNGFTDSKKMLLLK